jgi:ribosomal-protein-alanine N-acetyltransferase
MSFERALAIFPALTTPRLTLRQVIAADAPALFSIFSDAEHMRYYGSIPHREIEETQAMIDRMAQSYADRQRIDWGIAWHDAHPLIGTCSLHHFGAGYRRAEIGYSLHPAAAGQGCAREAVAAVLDFGFRVLGLHRIEAIIDIDNVPSKKLLEKLRFTYEGCLRQRFLSHRPEDDQMVDEHYFALLHHEWRGHA